MLILIIVAVIAVVIIVAATTQSTNKAVQADQSLKMVPGFRAALTDHAAGGVSLSIDPSSERLVIVSGNQRPNTYGFGQIVGVEIDRDGQTLTRTNRGSQVSRAAIGGVLLGPAGLLIGGLSASKRQEQKIQRITLKIFTNDLINPLVEVHFLNSRNALDVNSSTVKAAAKQADEWYGRLQTILQRRNAEPASFAEPARPAPIVVDPDLTRRARQVVERSRREAEERDAQILISYPARKPRK